MTACDLAALILPVVDSIKTDVPKPVGPGSEQALSTGAAATLEAAKNALEGHIRSRRSATGRSGG